MPVPVPVPGEQRASLLSARHAPAVTAPLLATSEGVTEPAGDVSPPAADGELPWLLATVAGLLLYLGINLVYLRYGSFAADEGWYVEAMRRVLAGELPYRDFAFTQMPLMPYVYALAQALFGPSILLGRLTSLVLSLATALLAVLVARRYGGPAGGAVAALLLATLFYEAYHAVIVKTYILIALCCVASLALLGARLRDDARYPLAAALALAAAMTRLSALLFAVPIVLYCLAAPRERVWPARLLVGLVVAVTVALSAMFVLAAPDSASWHLVTHHSSQWGDASTGDKLRAILRSRLPNLVQNYTLPLALALAVSIAALARRDLRAFLRRHMELPVAGLGLALFAGSHLATGGWHPDYIAPAITAAVPILAALLGRMLSAGVDQSARGLVIGLLVAVLVLNPLGQVDRLNAALRDDRLLGRSGEVGAFVAAQTAPDDHILALEALSVAVEADRPLLPGLALAHFSYQDVPDEQAREFNVVNRAMLLQAIRSRSAAMLVLTERDWTMFARAGVYDRAPRDPEEFRQAVAEHYQPVAVFHDFGQFRTDVFLYARR